MPLGLYYRPSFERSLKKLDSTQKDIVAQILVALEAYYSHDCSITHAQKLSPRFFYKQLRKPYYEAGVERSLRVVLCREGGKCIAVLAGNHDQICRFLADA
jgi:hypothetical protein